MSIELVMNRINELQTAVNQGTTNLNMLIGMLNEAKNLHRMLSDNANQPAANENVEQLNEPMPFSEPKKMGRPKGVKKA